jgi:hypothetical protein
MFEYRMFYVLDPFMAYLLTLAPVKPRVPQNGSNTAKFTLNTL